MASGPPYPIPRLLPSPTEDDLDFLEALVCKTARVDPQVAVLRNGVVALICPEGLAPFALSPGFAGKTRGWSLIRVGSGESAAALGDAPLPFSSEEGVLSWHDACVELLRTLMDVHITEAEINYENASPQKGLYNPIISEQA